MMKIIPTFIRKLAAGLNNLADRIEKIKFIEIKTESSRKYGYFKFTVARKLDSYSNYFTYFGMYLSTRPSIEVTVMNIFMVIGVVRKYVPPKLTQEERDSIKEDL